MCDKSVTRESKDASDQSDHATAAVTEFYWPRYVK